MLQSWRKSMSGAVSALLDGGSPLQALYDGVRSRITQAIQDGLVVKRLLGSLDPLFTQLDEAISKGMNPNGIIASIGAASSRERQAVLNGAHARRRPRGPLRQFALAPDVDAAVEARPEVFAPDDNDGTAPLRVAAIVLGLLTPLALWGTFVLASHQFVL